MIVHLLSRKIVNGRSFIYHGRMSPRRRTVSDVELLHAAARAVSRVGPVRLTLAHVAAEASIAPATLVQRFGSKRGLLLAMVQMSSSGVSDQFAALRAAHSSPLAALHAIADCMAGLAATPEELANHLAFLHMDLTDPDFHALALAHARVFSAELKGLLDDAVARDELIGCDTTSLARLIPELIHGALVTWAIYREGSAQEWTRREMETLLAPYTRPNRRSSRGKRGS
jgi:AcrR family transcriptional regulator